MGSGRAQRSHRSRQRNGEGMSSSRNGAEESWEPPNACREREKSGGGGGGGERRCSQDENMQRQKDKQRERE